MVTFDILRTKNQGILLLYFLVDYLTLLFGINVHVIIL